MALNFWPSCLSISQALGLDYRHRPCHHTFWEVRPRGLCTQGKHSANPATSPPQGFNISTSSQWHWGCWHRDRIFKINNHKFCVLLKSFFVYLWFLTIFFILYNIYGVENNILINIHTFWARDIGLVVKCLVCQACAKPMSNSQRRMDGEMVDDWLIDR